MSKDSFMLVPDNFSHKAGDGRATRKRRISKVVPALQANSGATQAAYVVQEKKKIKSLGSIYKSKHEAGNVYDPTGISPTIKCNGPRPNMKNICPKIIVLGNVGNGHEAQNVYHPKGIAPTVRENHGKVTKVVVKKEQLRVWKGQSGIVYKSEGNAPTLYAKGTGKTGSNAPIVLVKPTKPMVYDQQNDKWRKDDLVGTLCGEGLKRGNRGFVVTVPQTVKPKVEMKWLGYSRDKKGKKTYHENTIANCVKPPTASQAGYVVVTTIPQEEEQKSMKYLSLFSGIGGFEYGIEKAWASLARKQVRVPCDTGGDSTGVDTKQHRKEQPKQSSSHDTTEDEFGIVCDSEERAEVEGETDEETDSSMSEIGVEEGGFRTSSSSRGGGETETERTWEEDPEGLRERESQSHDEGDKGLAGRGATDKQHTNGCGDRQPTCIGFSEIDKYAIQIYEKQFPTHRNYHDVTKLDPKDLPNFDLLVGGFPCQAFSIAGKRGGFDDTRGTLFFEIIRILRDKKPRLVLLENVKGLLSHDGGFTFQTIIKNLSDLGYSVEWEVLNSKDFGVPQNRERVFIVGYLGTGSGRKVFPLREGDGISDEGTEDGELAVCLSASSYKGVGNDGVTMVGSPVKDMVRLDAENKAICSMDHSATLTAKSSKNSSKSGNYKDHNLICKIGTLRTHKDGRGFREVSGDVSPAIPARAREDGSGQPVIWDTYNNSVRKDKVTCTLTHNTGSSSLRAGQKVILRGKKKR